VQRRFVHGRSMLQLDDAVAATKAIGMSRTMSLKIQSGKREACCRRSAGFSLPPSLSIVDFAQSINRSSYESCN
jgi:hypothetical protein